MSKIRITCAATLLMVCGCNAYEKRMESKEEHIVSLQSAAAQHDAAARGIVLRGDRSPEQRERWEQQATDLRRQADRTQRELDDMRANPPTFRELLVEGAFDMYLSFWGAIFKAAIDSAFDSLTSSDDDEEECSTDER